jgi:hypothetical protein
MGPLERMSVGMQSDRFGARGETTGCYACLHRILDRSYT